MTPEEPEGWPRPEGQAGGPRVETVDDRLSRLEQAMSGLNHPGPSVAGLASSALAAAVLPALAGKAADADPGFLGRLTPLRELRLMLRMYVDPHYRLSRVAQFGVPCVVALMVLNYLLFNFWQLPIISLVFPIIERLLLVVLSVVLYKLLSREAARYDAVLQYLARYGR